MELQGAVLVAGGAGFVGGHLIERLLDAGCEVICLDNLCTGSQGLVDALGKRTGFSFVRGDVRELPDLPPVDWVFNLACPASPRHYQADPIGTLMTSVEGTRRLLEFTQATGARLLQASTSEVYGSPLFHPQHESHWGNVNPVGPRACYDEGKRCAETLCVEYRRTRGVSVRIARIFNTYGPGMSAADGRVIPSFVHQALRRRAVTVFGDGRQTRSFCFVDDLVEGLIRLMACEDEQIQPVNLGNPAEVSMLELLDSIERVLGFPVDSQFEGLPEDDPPFRCPDIDQAITRLGWQPSVSLEDGLRRYVMSCLSESSAGASRSPGWVGIATAGD